MTGTMTIRCYRWGSLQAKALFAHVADCAGCKGATSKESMCIVGRALYLEMIADAVVNGPQLEEYEP